MTQDARQRWFATMMESGLEQKMFAPADVLTHATPEVLANHLPPDLMTKVLRASLDAGAMTPDGVLECVPPELLAKHIPHDVLWQCISNAAERAGITHSKK